MKAFGHTKYPPNALQIVRSCPLCPILSDVSHQWTWIGHIGQDRTAKKGLDDLESIWKDILCVRRPSQFIITVHTRDCAQFDHLASISGVLSVGPIWCPIHVLPCPMLSYRKSGRVGALFSKTKVGIKNLKNWSCGMIKDKENCIVKSSRSQTSRALSLTRQTIILSDLRLQATKCSKKQGQSGRG